MEVKQSKNTDFFERIAIKQDKEKERLLKLQQDFDEGRIDEDEISEEDIEKLCNLYDEQIAEIEKSTEVYKKRIIEIRKKLYS